MKFIATTEPLAEALAFLSRVTKGRMARVRPIMGCVRITCEAKAKPIRLEAHNGEQWVSMTLDQVDVQDPGECAVSCEMLARAVSNCGNAPTVTCETEDARLSVRGDWAVTRLWTLEAKEFPPPIDIGTAIETMEVPGPTVRLCLDRALGCVGEDTDKYSVAGVRVRHEGKRLSFAGTDGRIAALAGFNVPEKATKTLEFVIPKESARLTLSRLERWQEGDAVFVHIGESGCSFTVANTEMRSACLEAKFIPLEAHIPEKCEKTIDIDSAILAGCVRAAGMFADEKYGTRCVMLTPNGKTVAVSSGRPEEGDYAGQVDATMTGDPPAFGTKARYILEAIRGAGTPQIRLEVTSPKKPIVVRGGNEYIVFWQPLTPEA